jgi:hypothetical protein
MNVSAIHRCASCGAVLALVAATVPKRGSGLYEADVSNPICGAPIFGTDGKWHAFGCSNVVEAAAPRAESCTWPACAEVAKGYMHAGVIAWTPLCEPHHEQIACEARARARAFYLAIVEAGPRQRGDARLIRRLRAGLLDDFASALRLT